MKHTFVVMLAGAMALASGRLEASPWGCPPPLPQVYFEVRHNDYPERSYQRPYQQEVSYEGDGCRESFRDRAEVRAQLQLRRLGYYRGGIDGVFGYGSQRALIRFQEDNDLPVTGRLDRWTRRALRI